MVNTSLLRSFVAIAGCAIVVSASGSQFLFESATLGGPIIDGQAGGTELSQQLLGVRFQLGSTVQVQSVGGDILGFSGTLFAAIVPLSSLSAFPTGASGSLDALAATAFTPPFPGEDINIPLSVTLTPGVYALIFGSDQFGASGSGAMPRDNVDIPGNASFIDYAAFSSTPGWFDSPDKGYRFVVKGTTISANVPETGSSLCLLALGLLAVVFLRQFVPKGT
jgi:hypothetical protein